MVGQVLGAVGALPDIYTELEISYFLLRRLLGVRTEGDKKGAKVRRGGGEGGEGEGGEGEGEGGEGTGGGGEVRGRGREVRGREVEVRGREVRCIMLLVTDGEEEGE